MDYDIRAIEGGPPNWPELNEALAAHDGIKVYTLLTKKYKFPIAGQMLLKLIRSVPDWPKAQSDDYDFCVGENLSYRELQVLQCASRGLSNRDTAKELILGMETVKSHRRHLMRKLNVATMAKAVHAGHKLGWID